MPPRTFEEKSTDALKALLSVRSAVRASLPGFFFTLRARLVGRSRTAFWGLFDRDLCRRQRRRLVLHLRTRPRRAGVVASRLSHLRASRRGAAARMTGVTSLQPKTAKARSNNNSMQRTALRAAAEWHDLGRQHHGVL